MPSTAKVTSIFAINSNRSNSNQSTFAVNSNRSHLSLPYTEQLGQMSSNPAVGIPGLCRSLVESKAGYTTFARYHQRARNQPASRLSPRGMRACNNHGNLVPRLFPCARLGKTLVNAGHVSPRIWEIEIVTREGR